MDVSPAIGIPYPLVVCLESGISPSSGIWFPVWVCFGSESDISPAIGIRIPRLPVSVVFGVRELSYGCSDSSWSKKIRMHRMRHPSEHVFPPVRTTATLMSMIDRLSRPRMRYPAESVLFVFLCLFQPV
jgi:hypothetical protein